MSVVNVRISGKSFFFLRNTTSGGEWKVLRGLLCVRESDHPRNRPQREGFMGDICYHSPRLHSNPPPPPPSTTLSSSSVVTTHIIHDSQERTTQTLEDGSPCLLFNFVLLFKVRGLGYILSQRCSDQTLLHLYNPKSPLNTYTFQSHLITPVSPKVTYKHLHNNQNPLHLLCRDPPLHIFICLSVYTSSIQMCLFPPTQTAFP